MLISLVFRAAEWFAPRPTPRNLLARHQRSLDAARGHQEPAGQIAARELELVRIKGALQSA